MQSWICLCESDVFKPFLSTNVLKEPLRGPLGGEGMIEDVDDPIVDNIEDEGGRRG